MSARLWILGAPDPEMAAIEELLRTAGEPAVYASRNGERVHGGDAYLADSVPGATHWVECESPGQPRDEVIDHHRPGDPGYGGVPEYCVRDSSLGQVIAILAGDIDCRLPWIGSGESRDTAYYSGAGFVFRRRGDVWVVDDHYGQRTIPMQLVLVAAADHCLAHAYAGRCPGVDPDALMRWRVESRAAHQGRTADELLADVDRAREALLAAPEIDMTGGHSYAPPVMVRDMRGVHVAELPEAGTRYGISYVADGLPGPDGRKKVVISGERRAIELFFDGFSSANKGLVDLYGDPARGFAGGYLPK